MVTADISVEVPNPDLSGGDEPFEPMPTVKKIDFGFYAVPMHDDIAGFITSVDTGLLTPHVHTDICGYISSEAYISTHLPKVYDDPYAEGSSWMSAYSDGELPSRMSVYNEPLKTSGDYYAKTTSHCSLYPYKDPIHWAINPFSEAEFPNNIEVYNDMDLL
jgi:hypothetical protein